MNADQEEGRRRRSSPVGHVVASSRSPGSFWVVIAIVFVRQTLTLDGVPNEGCAEV